MQRSCQVEAALRRHLTLFERVAAQDRPYIFLLTGFLFGGNNIHRNQDGGNGAKACYLIVYSGKWRRCTKKALPVNPECPLPSTNPIFVNPECPLESVRPSPSEAVSEAGMLLKTREPSASEPVSIAKPECC